MMTANGSNAYMVTKGISERISVYDEEYLRDYKQEVKDSKYWILTKS